MYMKAKTIIQCVNCGISLTRQRRIWMMEETEELRQLLSDWTNKEVTKEVKELEDNDAVCMECYHLLRLATESEDKSRKFGHKIICLTCGASLLGRRMSPLLDERLECKLILAQQTPPHQVKRLEHVCWKCFGRASKQVEKQNIVHSETNDVSVKIEPLHSILSLGDGELDIPASPESKSDEEENVPEKYSFPVSINLPTYKRAAATSRRCIFKNCTRPERHKIPKAILERLLIDYSYYFPPKSRICKPHHVNSHKAWQELVNQSSITDFTSDQIEHLLSILKNSRCTRYCRSFESEIRQDEYLCQYLLGVNFRKYEEMLKGISLIRKTVWCTKKGLTMYLMKKHTGFSPEKLAKFFGMRPKWLVKIIHRVHVHLVASDDSYVAVPTIGCDDKEEIVTRFT